MSWDVQLEVFKRIFVFRSKIDFFPRGKSRVLILKMTKFDSRIFHSFMSLAISACRKIRIFHSFMSLGISACEKNRFDIIFKCK